MKLAEPTIAAEKAVRIAGLKEHYTPDRVAEIPQLWGRLMPHLGKIAGQVGHVTYGVGVDMNKGGVPGFDYFAGVEVTASAELAPEFASVNLPAQKYFVFQYDGHVSQVPSLVTEILNQWAPQHRDSLGSYPNLVEVYGEDFNPQTGLGSMQFWVPRK
jgi:AraC family transcriptional regulator